MICNIWNIQGRFKKEKESTSVCLVSCIILVLQQNMLKKIYLKIVDLLHYFQLKKDTRSALDKLPEDIFYKILSNLHGKDIVQVAQLNKNFRNMVYTAVPSISDETSQQSTTYFQLVKKFNNSPYFTLKCQIKKLKEKKTSYYYDVVRYSNIFGSIYTSYEYSFQVYVIGIIASLIISIGAGAYTGKIFHEIFDSKFIAWENGIISGAISFFCTERITLFSARVGVNYCRFQENEISKKIDQLEVDLTKIEKPELLELQNIHKFKRCF